MDKSNIYFSNGKQIAEKRSMEYKQNNYTIDTAYPGPKTFNKLAD